MNLNLEDLKKIDRVRKLNIINSITGIKPANLIGTQSANGQANCAIFSSVVHLGSDPALLGFILRPTGEIPRNTLENIEETRYYSINAIPEHLIKNAHYTSAKFDRSVNEFERCNIEAQYLEGFHSPFVKKSPIKIGLKFMEQVPIQLNGTILIVGAMEHLIIDDDLVDEKGYINLAHGNITGISGLNSYYSLNHIASFPYARVNEVPEF